MKGDIPLAAFRLLSSNTLIVRTHERKSYVRLQASTTSDPIKVGGVTYESIAEASRQLGYSRGKLRKMIERGKASYG